MLAAGWAGHAQATTYYVRQTVGDDRNDGLSPDSAWRGLYRLSNALRAGDVGYVGPGLYRERLVVAHDGAAGRPITVVGDATGHRTGDPPGPVVLAGSDPLDESIFVPHSTPGVYVATIVAPDGVVEMDGPQYRYTAAGIATLHLRDGVPELDVVAQEPSTYFYDAESKRLYVHTSDGYPPSTHDIEVVRRSTCIFVSGRTFVRVIGFTVRHAGDAGINFYRGSQGGMALGNTAYGNHEGIRVYGTVDVTIAGNTLLRNQDAGVYFALQSVNGRAMGNTSYDNIKGLRWSSESANGLAVDNVLVDNHRYGVAIEHSDGMTLIRNDFVGNGDSQIMVTGSAYSSFDNCFSRAGPSRFVAHFVLDDLWHVSLAEYRRRHGQDLGSREGECAPPPQRVDVRALHDETITYVERARKILGVDPPT
jgi:parallel beta-helix repeat protein